MRAFFVCLAIGAFVMAVAPDPAPAQDQPCQSTVEQVLAMHGMKLSDVEVFGWRTDRFAYKGGEDGPVDGYRFYARPKSCQDGELSIEMGSGCGLQDTFTHGGCRIKGIPHIWW
jgi:hypothetical protein